MEQNKYVQDWFDFQKKSFDFWQNAMQMNKVGAAAPENVFAFNNDMLQNGMKPVQEMMNKWMNMTNEMYAQNMQNAGQFAPNLFNQDLLKGMFQGASNYQNMYKFYEDLMASMTGGETDPTKFYKKWQEDYGQMFYNQIISAMPEQIQSFYDEGRNIFQLSEGTADKFFSPWQESAKTMQDLMARMVTGDQAAFGEFYDQWNKNYAASYGKLFKIGSLPLSPIEMGEQMESINAYIELASVVGEFMASIATVYQETMVKLVTDFKDMMVDGTAPKTFQEFYAYWLKQNESAFLKLFGTAEFARLSAKLLASAMTFKKETDDVIAKQLSFLPYPNKDDMNSVYKKIDTLKRDNRAIKAELTEIKDSFAELGDIKALKKEVTTLKADLAALANVKTMQEDIVALKEQIAALQAAGKTK